MTLAWAFSEDDLAQFSHVTVQLDSSSLSGRRVRNTIDKMIVIFKHPNEYGHWLRRSQPNRYEAIGVHLLR